MRGHAAGARPRGFARAFVRHPDRDEQQTNDEQRGTITNTTRPA
jgi:hypothetical protein